MKQKRTIMILAVVIVLAIAGFIVTREKAPEGGMPETRSAAVGVLGDESLIDQIEYICRNAEFESTLKDLRSPMTLLIVDRQYGEDEDHRILYFAETDEFETVKSPEEAESIVVATKTLLPQYHIYKYELYIVDSAFTHAVKLDPLNLRYNDKLLKVSAKNMGLNDRKGTENADRLLYSDMKRIFEVSADASDDAGTCMRFLSRADQQIGADVISAIESGSAPKTLNSSVKPYMYVFSDVLPQDEHEPTMDEVMSGKLTYHFADNVSIEEIANTARGVSDPIAVYYWRTGVKSIGSYNVGTLYTYNYRYAIVNIAEQRLLCLTDETWEESGPQLLNMNDTYKDGKHTIHYMKKSAREFFEEKYFR